MLDNFIFNHLLPIYQAFEAMAEFEPTATHWEADLRPDGTVFVAFHGLDLSRLYNSPQEVIDYFRAEYILRRVFPSDVEWWPLWYLEDFGEN